MSSELPNEGVLATFTTMSEAWARMDAARFAACYADDATDASCRGPVSVLLRSVSRREPCRNI